MIIKAKDPGSAMTHFIGFLMVLTAAIPLLTKTIKDSLHLISVTVFIVSMMLLYAASTIYHTLDISERINCILRKMDHIMIFILIAGSYTPICLITLHGRTGWILFGFVWGIAIAGIIIKACWITCPKWFSSVLYIAMGWVCIFALKPIMTALPMTGFLWLLAGGIIYTIGGIIYALKLPIFNARHKNFGSHEIFHLFVMGGSLCHIILIYEYVAAMPIL